MYKRLLSVAGAALFVAGLLAAPAVRTPAMARVGPMTRQPLEQLRGDSFDEAFLARMTMHHAMAVMMARPLVANPAHHEAADLANAIIEDQTREITQMRTWAQTWYGVTIPDPLAMMDSMMPSGQPGSMPGGIDHSRQGMPGGMMPGGQGMPHDMMGEMTMMADMWKLPPARLEAVFLSMMIPHHQGALDMAALVPSRAAHQELKDLAEAITQSQSTEIAKMNSWLSAWYGL